MATTEETQGQRGQEPKNADLQREKLRLEIKELKIGLLWKPVATILSILLAISSTVYVISSGFFDTRFQRLSLDKDVLSFEIEKFDARKDTLHSEIQLMKDSLTLLRQNLAIIATEREAMNAEVAKKTQEVNQSKASVKELKLLITVLYGRDATASEVIRDKDKQIEELKKQIQELRKTLEPLSATTGQDITRQGTPIALAMPTMFSIQQNYPNPFDSVTTFQFSIPESSVVSVQVFDLLGKTIRSLSSGMMGPGQHILQWDGKDDVGNLSRPGVYYLTMRAGAYSHTIKMVKNR